MYYFHGSWLAKCTKSSPLNNVLCSLSMFLLPWMNPRRSFHYIFFLSAIDAVYGRLFVFVAFVRLRGNSYCEERGLKLSHSIGCTKKDIQEGVNNEPQMHRRQTEVAEAHALLGTAFEVWKCRKLLVNCVSCVMNRSWKRSQ